DEENTKTNGRRTLTDVDTRRNISARFTTFLLQINAKASRMLACQFISLTWRLIMMRLKQYGKCCRASIVSQLSLPGFASSLRFVSAIKRKGRRCAKKFLISLLFCRSSWTRQALDYLFAKNACLVLYRGLIES